jgi:hypothetical protein
MVMMVVVMVMPVPPDDDGPVVMMMVVMVSLRQLHSGLRRCGRRPFIDHLQGRRRIRDWLQQVGVGIGLQNIRLLGCRDRRGLGGRQGADRGHRSKKSSYSLFHDISLQCAIARERNAG